MHFTVYCDLFACKLFVLPLSNDSVGKKRFSGRKNLPVGAQKNASGCSCTHTPMGSSTPGRGSTCTLWSMFVHRLENGKKTLI